MQDVHFINFFINLINHIQLTTDSAIDSRAIIGRAIMSPRAVVYAQLSCSTVVTETIETLASFQ